MRIKRLLIWLLAGALALGCAGCQLARPDMGEEASGDRLIGVFVTEEYLDLFDFESYFADNAGKLMDGGEISPEDTAAYTGRYYATPQGDDYVFEGLEGMGFYCYYRQDAAGAYHASHIDEGIVSDAGLHIFSTDEGDRVEMDGTVYFTPQSRVQIYCNPVYQTAGGDVYIVPEGGFMTDTVDCEGEIWSTTLEETTTVTENGETTSAGCKVTMRLAVMFAPTEITVIQMDEASREISRASYAPEDVPEALALEDTCAYVIAQTHKLDGSGKPITTYALFDPAQDGYMQTFYARPDGVCVRQDTELIFPGRADI